MHYFQKYIERHKVAGAVLSSTELRPDIIVVIPCYDEPNVLSTLDSLFAARRDGLVVELIILINSGEHTPDDVVLQNKQTYAEVMAVRDKWGDGVIVSPVLVENIRRKHAGAGYARKLGMDQAVFRFRESENDKGIIVSLDADTLVEDNYFEEIYKCFVNYPKLYGAVVRFEHFLKGDFSPEVYSGIAHYELHLRYVNQALKYCGFPYAHHTVGSAFAVRADAYVKHGGMNRRQGGEDFYFLHKLFPHGQFVELNSTCVYPSSRPSHRVPFGTGPQVSEFLVNEQLLTYNLDAFLCLKEFFAQVPRLYQSDDVDFTPEINDFLNSIAYYESVIEIRKNSASVDSFVKRFYVFFDAFKVVKFLNFSHQNYYKKNDVVLESARLLGQLQDNESSDVLGLLGIYRKVESD